MAERGDAQCYTQAQWAKFTDRFRSLRGVCCLSTVLLQFSPQVSLQCLEPGDVGLLVNGQSGALPFYLKPPGNRQQCLLHGVIYIPAWLDLVPSQWLHLLLDEGTAPARRLMSLTLPKLSYQTIFFSESRTFFLGFMLQLQNLATGPWSGLSKASLWLSREQNLGMDLETGTGLDQRTFFVFQQFSLTVQGCSQDFQVTKVTSWRQRLPCCTQLYFKVHIPYSLKLIITCIETLPFN